MEEFSNICGGRGRCSKCGQMFSNVAYHESICGKEDCHDTVCPVPLSENKLVDSKQVLSDSLLRIKDLEEENRKLKNTVRILSERLSKTSKKMNKIQDDFYNDITPDRDDYR